MRTADELKQAAREARERVGKNDQDQEQTPYVLRGGSIIDYRKRGIHTQDILVGDGWLERGSFFLLVAQSGVGKSQAIVQICCCWACGKGGASAFFLDPFDGRALRIIIIQNEDSGNDIHRQSCVVDALGLNDEQLELLHKNLWIETVRGKLGAAAIDVIRKILDLRNGCDLLVLNPLSAYAKGDLTRTEDAGEFLYGQFSQLLDDFNCGGGAAHHTPKSTGTTQKSKDKWSSWDFMYSGAGAATMTNHSRAYMTIDPKGDSRVFDVRMAKRVEQSGWTASKQMFRWEQRGDSRIWVPASVAEAEKAQASSQKSIEDLLKLVPLTGKPIPKETLEHKACKGGGGFTRQNYRAVLAQAHSESTPDALRLYDWKIYNPDGGPLAAIARVPQPLEQKPEVIKAGLKEAKAQQVAAAKEAKRQAAQEAKHQAKIVKLPI
jgi:hypothetical protein